MLDRKYSQGRGRKGQEAALLAEQCFAAVSYGGLRLQCSSRRCVLLRHLQNQAQAAETLHSHSWSYLLPAGLEPATYGS